MIATIDKTFDETEWEYETTKLLIRPNLEQDADLNLSINEYSKIHQICMR